MIYELDLDECLGDLWSEMERVQDGKNGHIITMDSLSAHDASVELLHRLIPFFAKQFKEDVDA